MNLVELAEISRSQVEYTVASDGNIHCRIQNGEIKDSCDSGVLSGTFGQGSTMLKAARDYAKKIRGKILVLGAYTNYRHEYDIPTTLRAGNKLIDDRFTTGGKVR